MIARTLLVSFAACILIPTVFSDIKHNMDIGPDVEDHIPLPTDIRDEDINMKSLVEAYEKYWDSQAASDIPRDQDKYEVWKRNADVINTLLGFPRRMLLAGR